MSSNIPSTSFFPTSKRSACDRCREQKLRCPTRENGTKSCARCIRAGLECVTSYTKPLGRSARDVARMAPKMDAQPATVPDVDMARKRPMSMNLDLPQSRNIPVTTTTESTSLNTDDTSLSPWLLSEGSEKYHFLAQDGWPTPTHEDASNSSSLSNALFLSNDLSPSSNLNERGDSLVEDSSILSSLHSTCELGTTGRTTYPDSIMKETHRRRPSGSVESVLSGAECDLRLSQLSLDLCRQMQLCITESHRWDTTTMDRKASENPFNFMRKGADGQSNSNAFGDALCSTSEFLTILQSYGRGDANSSSAGSNNHRTASNATSQPSLDFVCNLNLMSSYLRIIAIFDSLYLRLYELLCYSTTSSAGSFAGAGLQILPGLQLAGFSVQQGSFQTKILIQVTQHQFEMIERILGLPTELRVSDRRDVYPMGLLSDGLAKGLLQVVINGQHSGEGATMLPFDWDPAVGSLGSLRRNVMKVRQMLDM